jgi:hypothetical protein
MGHPIIVFDALQIPVIALCFCGSSNVMAKPPLPFPFRLCDNLKGFVTLSCRNLEASLFCSRLF